VLAFVAGLVSLACILASCHRLALKEPADLGQLREGLAGFECWERDAFDAACASERAARGPLIDEQVIEADWSTERWIRVPRVGASIATSAGFLCACVILIQALGADTSDPAIGGATGSSLTLALDALALGIVGTAFCVAVHLRARVVTRQRRAAVDQLVDRLRTLAIS
jgi:hypothetical protein